MGSVIDRGVVRQRCGVLELKACGRSTLHLGLRWLDGVVLCGDGHDLRRDRRRAGSDEGSDGAAGPGWHSL